MCDGKMAAITDSPLNFLGRDGTVDSFLCCIGLCPDICILMWAALISYYLIIILYSLFRNHNRLSRQYCHFFERPSQSSRAESSGIQQCGRFYMEQ